MQLRTLTAVLIFHCSFAYAQKIPDNILFDHVPVPGTIHSALTEDIVQDEYGMMWVAKDALYRYDGREFKKYDAVSNDSSLFNSRELTVLFWDHAEHRLLVGTRSFGVLQYKYDNDRLESLPSKHGRPIVTDIARTAQGLLITSMTSGLFELVNDTLVKVSKPADLKWPSQVVVAGETAWITCQNEVVALRGHQIVQRLSFKKLQAFAGATVRASCLMFDRKGNLWVGSERDGIAVIDTAQRKVIRKFLSSTVGSEAWNSRDLKSRPH